MAEKRGGGAAPLGREREEKKKEQGGMGLHHSEQHTANATNRIFLTAEYERSKM